MYSATETEVLAADAERATWMKPMTRVEDDAMAEGEHASPLHIGTVNKMSEMMTASDVMAMYSAWVARLNILFQPVSLSLIYKFKDTEE